MGWTDEQLDAIKTRGKNLLVSAAAGSGKTAVLVERIIKIITDSDIGVSIDKLLVVTFTNAAASEMRERIASAISEKLQENPMSENLKHQLTLLNRANITTMHSFCLDVIRNNFYKIDIDPTFRIGDDTEIRLIKSDILDELFDEKYEKEDEEFNNLAEVINTYRSDDKLKELILNVYNFVMSNPWPEKWLNEKSNDFNISTVSELEHTKWITVLKENMKIELDGMIRLLEKGVEIIKDTPELNAYLDTFNDDLLRIKNAYSSIDEGLDLLYKNLLKMNDFGRLKTIKKNTISDERTLDSVKGIRDNVKKKVKELLNGVFSQSPEDMANNIKNCYPYMKELSKVVIDFKNKFTDKKKEKNIVDFNDLEHLCLEILSEKDEDGNIKPSETALSYRDYFDEILIDEYQDSNDVQEEIINLISKKHSTEPNVFMVGDVKQSIYRFRQAKPQLFIKKQNEYASEINQTNKLIRLNKNFRSREEIINGINFLFKNIMSPIVGEVNYDEDEKLNLGAEYDEVSDDSYSGGAIEVKIIDKGSDEVLDDDSDNDSNVDLEEVQNSNIEGIVIAEKINNLMSQSENKKFKIYDKNISSYRDLQYKDIVILLRATKNYTEGIMEELGKRGIPAYADTGTGYFDTIEIKTIMSLLKIIDNPIQDVPLIAILKSPIMNFTMEDLSSIRLVNKNDYFYNNIVQIADNEDTHNELSGKCKYFLTKLIQWRKKSLYVSIDEFIWYLYMDTSYYGFVGAMPNGVLRQANLRILFQRARQFESTSFKGLFNFINYINKLIKSSGDMGSAKIIGENENVVRIMSIHKSKGLEFPVVFLAGTGKRFNLMDMNGLILYHDELGFGPDYVDLYNRTSIGTIAKNAIKKKIKFETLSEEMRILYVACTRAREKLIITGCLKNASKSIEKWFNSSCINEGNILPSEILRSNSFLDWIGMALCKNQEGNKMSQYIGATQNTFSLSESKWDIDIIKNGSIQIENEDDSEDKKEVYEINDETRAQDDKEVQRKLGFEYKFKELTTLKSNVSVSELKRKNEEQNYEISDNIFRKKNRNVLVPKFLREDKGLSASEKGTAMHFVMKKLDFSKADSEENIKKQIEDLYNDKFITKKEAESINVKKIIMFLKSKLGKMMLESYKNNEKIYREFLFYTNISALKVDKNLGEKYKDSTVRLQGIIDCFFEYKGNIILFDYKTDYVKNNDEQSLILKYNSQIDYYSNAILKVTGKKVYKKYIYSFYLNKEIEVS
ncbi:helicase-exonuclease AddAB subunit AddA [Clostridium sp. BJN0001]|uniref:helicase-exonuclease AddAB subunit AddA n=1 Tax=Clostridium sp. BJN0001 TaxID=2930219 RepID=UPI001FD19CC7|nr:helicase-exonuclease AddAB subunit AddA [Clostridium sp. BJN0001]